MANVATTQPVKKLTVKAKADQLKGGKSLDLNTLSKIQDAFSIIKEASLEMNNEIQEVVEFMTAQAKEDLTLQLDSAKKQNEVKIADLDSTFVTKKRKMEEEYAELEDKFRKLNKTPQEFEQLTRLNETLKSNIVTLEKQAEVTNYQIEKTALEHKHAIDILQTELKSEKASTGAMFGQIKTLQAALDKVNTTITEFMTGKLTVQSYGELTSKLEGLLQNRK